MASFLHEWWGLNKKCAVNVCTWIRIFFPKDSFLLLSLRNTELASCCQESPWPHWVEFHSTNPQQDTATTSSFIFLHPSTFSINPGEKYSFFNHGHMDCEPWKCLRCPNQIIQKYFPICGAASLSGISVLFFVSDFHPGILFCFNSVQKCVIPFFFCPDWSWNMECWIRGRLDLLVCNLQLLKLDLRADLKVNLFYSG